ncbi:MAG: GIY-YIG nuclease family protein [Candidatus Marinimicrobia bacterium]|nr:GIY-YIG nuclease family protein [Candidatus Neomarinimicrobiota bacterium]
MKLYYVYIMSSLSRRLYIGITSDLEGRVWQHKNRIGSQFTSKYNINRLVWYEETNDVWTALEYEKKMKKWRREKKINLIEEFNSGWLDLSENWYK